MLQDIHDVFEEFRQRVYEGGCESEPMDNIIGMHTSVDIKVLVASVYLHPRAEVRVSELIRKHAKDWLPGVPVFYIPDRLRPKFTMARDEGTNSLRMSPALHCLQSHVC